MLNKECRCKTETLESEACFCPEGDSETSKPIEPVTLWETGQWGSLTVALNSTPLHIIMVSHDEE